MVSRSGRSGAQRMRDRSNEAGGLWQGAIRAGEAKGWGSCMQERQDGGKCPSEERKGQG
jgi:hypothetical protein